MMAMARTVGNDESVGLVEFPPGDQRVTHARARIQAVLDLPPVGHAVLIRIGIEGIGLVHKDLISVGQPVGIGIHIVWVGSCFVFT